MDQSTDYKKLPFLLILIYIVSIISYMFVCHEHNTWHKQMHGVNLKTHSIFSFGITGSFSNSDICGRNMCKHGGGLGISMDYAEKESEETLTQRCVGLSNWLNWNLLSLTVIIYYTHIPRLGIKSFHCIHAGLISHSYIMKYSCSFTTFL